MIASRLNMISSPPPPPSSAAETGGGGWGWGKMQIFFFFFLSAVICCIIMDEILFTQVYSPQRPDTSQVRLDGYRLQILTAPRLLPLTKAKFLL